MLLDIKQQWGVTSAAANGTTSFPITFSSNVYSVLVTQSGYNNNAGKYTERVKSASKTSFAWVWGELYVDGGFLYFAAFGK